MPRFVCVTLCLLSLVACAPNTPDLTVEEAEAVVLAFYGHISEYRLDELRAAVTPDFEIIEGGRRQNVEGFVSFLGGLQSRGIDLTFELTHFKTEVVGDVAYTSNRMVSGGGSEYLDATIIRRTSEGWLVDRAFSVPVALEP